VLFSFDVYVYIIKLHAEHEIVNLLEITMSISKLYVSGMENLKHNDINEITAFNNTLNAYDYGYIVDGKPVIEFDDFDKYRTISPEDFAKYKIGVCWDYVAFEYVYFMKHFKNTNPRCFYIQCNTTNHQEPTHTWLGFEYNGKTYSFESSWQTEQGIREFDSVKEMLKYYKKAQLTFISKQNMHCTGYTIREFEQPSKFNLNPSEYMKYCLTHGKVRMEENFKPRF